MIAEFNKEDFEKYSESILNKVNFLNLYSKILQSNDRIVKINRDEIIDNKDWDFLVDRGYQYYVLISCCETLRHEFEAGGYGCEINFDGFDLRVRAYKAPSRLESFLKFLVSIAMSIFVFTLIRHVYVCLLR